MDNQPLWLEIGPLLIAVSRIVVLSLIIPCPGDERHIAGVEITGGAAEVHIFRLPPKTARLQAGASVARQKRVRAILEHHLRSG